MVHNLLFGVILIFAVQWIFLGNLRSAVVVAATIPFALFFAIIIMTIRGESANLLSVGAIDFGLVVDATVIMVENIFRHLAQRPPEDRPHPGFFERPPRTPWVPRQFRGHCQFGARGELGDLFFRRASSSPGSQFLFTLSGVEGYLGPMAKTYAYAIAGGLIATFTVSPALSSLLLAGKVEETETAISSTIRGLYGRVIEFTLANRILTLGSAGLLALLAILAGRSLGLEFLPKLEEGNLWIRATLPPSISLEAAEGYVNWMRCIIRSSPETQTVISQLGRPDDGTDTTGFFNAEFNVRR